MNKHEIIYAICGLVIRECQEHIALKQSMQNAREQLMHSPLYQQIKASGFAELENPTVPAAMEYYTNPQPTAYGEHHVSVGRGNKSRLEDESWVDAAWVSLGMGTKNLPSIQYSH